MSCYSPISNFKCFPVSLREKPIPKSDLWILSILSPLPTSHLIHTPSPCPYQSSLGCSCPGDLPHWKPLLWYSHGCLFPIIQIQLTCHFLREKQATRTHCLISMQITCYSLVFSWLFYSRSSLLHSHTQLRYKLLKAETFSILFIAVSLKPRI